MKFIAKPSQQWLQKRFRMINVPNDLRPITDIDRVAEVDPHSVDLPQSAIVAMWEACQNLYRTGAYPLLSLCVRRRGEIVLNRSLGYLDEERVATTQNPICLFSASKAITSVLIHLLAEQGKIDLEAPVSRYIPAFGANGKGAITILQLLSHRGGVPRVPKGIDTQLLFDHEAALALVCEAEPVKHAGRIQSYHAITSGFVFNELIKVTTGLNAQQYLDRYIRKPMGMRYFRYGLTKRDQANVAINASTGLDNGLINKALTNVLGADPNSVVELTNDPRFFKSIIPSANLYANAEEVTRFFQMLLNQGNWNGKQILQPKTVQGAVRAVGSTQLDRTLMLPLRFSGGFMLGGAPVGIYGLNTQQAYGHLGFANIFCWADPQREIAVSLMNTGKLVVGTHLKALPLMLNAISSQCEPVRQSNGSAALRRATAEPFKKKHTRID
ncbi:MAG: serine hydrolase domain-containing protein [Halioglobus sp.]